MKPPIPPRLIRAAIGAFSALLAGAATAGAAPGTAEHAASLAAGQQLVQQNCGMCHAIGRDDASPNPEAPRFRELHRRYDIEDLAEALSEGILTGHPAMPEFRFEPSETNSIILYLKSIQTDQKASLREPGSRPR